MFFDKFSRKELIIFITLAVTIFASVTGDVIVYGVSASKELNAETQMDNNLIVDMEQSQEPESSEEDETEPETEPATEPETEAPTEPETEAPTEPETEAPTETLPIVVEPTETLPVVVAPTPTVPPTTVAPTEAPTKAPTVYHGEPIGLPPAEHETNIVSIALDVPDFKQYDERWGHKYIATKTIKAIGCLVTAISEVYSYHNGEPTYPDAMVGKLEFLGNLLIWKSVIPVGLKYTVEYESGIGPNIMNNIYKRLKEGRPVIIGGTNNSGGMHWVVITGYNEDGSNTFKTSGFTINDPGGTARTTLADFLATYPKVERLVY